MHLFCQGAGRASQGERQQSQRGRGGSSEQRNSGQGAAECRSGEGPGGGQDSAGGAGQPGNTDDCQVQDITHSALPGPLLVSGPKALHFFRGHLRYNINSTFFRLRSEKGKVKNLKGTLLLQHLYPMLVYILSHPALVPIFKLHDVGINISIWM